MLRLARTQEGTKCLKGDCFLLSEYFIVSVYVYQSLDLETIYLDPDVLSHKL